MRQRERERKREREREGGGEKMNDIERDDYYKDWGRERERR